MFTLIFCLWQRAWGREQRAWGREQRAWGREQRAWGKEVSGSGFSSQLLSAQFRVQSSEFRVQSLKKVAARPDEPVGRGCKLQVAGFSPPGRASRTGLQVTGCRFQVCPLKFQSLLFFIIFQWPPFAGPMRSRIPYSFSFAIFSWILR
jgi:hypothetical protein